MWHDHSLRGNFEITPSRGHLRILPKQANRFFESAPRCRFECIQQMDFPASIVNTSARKQLTVRPLGRGDVGKKRKSA